MGQPHWEHFAHGADIGVRGIGATPAQAFEQAALAMSAVIVDVERVQPLMEIALIATAPDLELLFVDWLNRLIYEMAVRNMLFSDFSVRIEGDTLHATARGEAIDRARHQPAVEIKGATYTALRVAACGDGTWLAQCVVDV